MEPVYRYRAKCARVIDGDTFEADVDLGFYASLRIKVRVRDVDCPERGEVGWSESADFLRGLLANPFVIESYKDRRTFERWVCDVWVGDQSVADLIVENGYGQRV